MIRILAGRRRNRSFDGEFREHLFDLRLLFPERRADIGEDFPATQFRRMLHDWHSGLVVQCRAMAQHTEGGIRKWVAVHGLQLAQPPPACKPRSSRPFLFETF